MIKQYRMTFTPEMIRALLEKEKTQTRRLGGLKEVNKNPDDWILVFSPIVFYPEARFVFENKLTGKKLAVGCPYGFGDIILATETWKICGFRLDKPELQIGYKTSSVKPYDAEWRTVDLSDHTKYTQANYFIWHTGRFMPAFASRIKRVITNIRCQRIQDISEEDARAEGVADRFHFSVLWDTIHRKGGMGWDYNPWVFAPTLMGWRHANLI